MGYSSEHKMTIRINDITYNKVIRTMERGKAGERDRVCWGGGGEVGRIQFK